MADKMKVRNVFRDPDFSSFVRAAVEAGEALEKKGWELDREHYSQGTQSFVFKKETFIASLQVEQED